MKTNEASTIQKVLLSVLAISMLASTELDAQPIMMTKRLMNILDRIAVASGEVLVRPSIMVGSTPNIAYMDFRRKLIIVDSSVIRIADAYGDSADALIAGVVGHEYAHYCRGHEFDSKFVHTFGTFRSVQALNSDVAQLRLERQAEYEADYYGRYYAILAGYRVEPSTIIRYTNELLSDFGSGGQRVSAGEEISNDSYTSTHPAVHERDSVISTVYAELDEMVTLYYAANTMLLSGSYLEAGIVYEWMSRTVLVPQAAWNELVSKLLAMQKRSERTVFEESSLLGAASFAANFRGMSEADKVDVELLHYRCNSLIEILNRYGYNVEQLKVLREGLALHNVIRQCTSCNSEKMCSNHGKAAAKVRSAYNKVAKSRNVQVAASFNKNVAKRLLDARMALDADSNHSTLAAVDLPIGTLSIKQLQRTPPTVRVAYRRGKGRQIFAVDMLLEQCNSCKHVAIERSEDVIIQTVPGLRVESVLKRE